jgi:hypothetical protein
MIEVRRQFFSQRVVEDWNVIPADLKQSVNVKTSKMATELFVKKWWSAPDLEDD